jgi:hypothetical protein
MKFFTLKSVTVSSLIGHQGRVHPGRHRRHPAEPGRQQHKHLDDRELEARGPHQGQSGRVGQANRSVQQDAGRVDHLPARLAVPGEHLLGAGHRSPAAHRGQDVRQRGQVVEGI